MMVRAVFRHPIHLSIPRLVSCSSGHRASSARTDGDIDSWTYPDSWTSATADTGMTLAGWVFGETVLRATDSDEPVRMATMYVSHNYFRTVGVNLGRGVGFDGAGLDIAASPGSSSITISGSAGSAPAKTSSGQPFRSLASCNTVVGVTTAEVSRSRRSRRFSGRSPLIPLDDHPRLAASADFKFNREIEWVKVIGRLSRRDHPCPGSGARLGRDAG